MKHLFLFILCAAVFAVSCNLEPRKPSEDEVAALQKSHDDSIAVIVDSLKRINIYVPPLYNKNIFDSQAVKEYSKLASATNGVFEALVNSRLLTNEIVRILKDNGADNADLLLMIDKTSSMVDDIEVVKQGLSKVIAEISAYQNLHLGILMYGDKNVDGNTWFNFRDFGTDYAGARTFINSIVVEGGGDWPESVYDAFFKVDDQNFWRSDSKRMVILIGDACSLDKPKADHDLNDVIKKATEDKITMNFYPIIVTPSADNGSEFAKTPTYKEEKLVTNLYPNPGNGNITVEFAQTDDYVINIYDINGKPVYSENFSGIEWKKDLGMLRQGAFVFSAVTKSETYQRLKFIIL